MISIYNNSALLTFSCVIAATLGAVMGSFLNCAAGRMAKDEPFISGRSHCPACWRRRIWSRCSVGCF